MKRFLISINTACILLVTLFTALILSPPVFSLPPEYETPVQSGEWLYFDRGEVALICGYLGKEEHITIPDQIDGKPVTELRFNGIAVDGYFSGQFKSSCFFGEFYPGTGAGWTDPDPKTTHITIPDSVKRIGAYTFYNCLTLTEIDMPNSVTDIGERAFHSCKNLHKADLPKAVERIGDGAFGMTGIDSFAIPKGVKYVGDMAFYQTPITEITFPDTVEYIGENALSDCKKLSSVKLPANLNEISPHLFASCASLETVDIPETVHIIGTGAFGNCSALSSIKLPPNIREIPTQLFYNCASLETVEITEGVQTIGADAFAQCEKLKELHFPKSLRSAAGILEGNTSLKTVGFAFDKDRADTITGDDVILYLAFWEYRTYDINAEIVYGEKDPVIEPDPEPIPEEKTAAEKTRELLTITSIVFAALLLITICMLMIQKAAQKPKRAEQGSNLLTKYSSDVIICPNCGTSGGKEASYCTNCGKKLSKKKPKSKNDQ
ncbi:MAG: leucine-rich repeat domain-containing protein [Ruminococcaceae bacterium]|nr:leucine-rich repeat domain-containing protein [Oscillospiraceae bacterium]